jgi:hypothetical protein
MTGIGIGCGILLILIGLAGYVYGLSTGHASLTALIPAAFGLAIGSLSLIGRANDNLRKHVMHVAVFFGLVGFVIPAVRVLSNLGTFTWSAASIAQIAMAFVCLDFVILSVRSFITARRGSADN